MSDYVIPEGRTVTLMVGGMRVHVVARRDIVRVFSPDARVSYRFTTEQGHVKLDVQPRRRGLSRA